MKQNQARNLDQLTAMAGEAMGQNKETLSAIAASQDGAKVKAMMEGDPAIANALQTGDTEALRQAVTGILQTKEGARLAQQLGSMLKPPAK